MRSILKSLLLILLCVHTAVFAQQYNGYTLTSLTGSTTATLMDTNQVTFKTWTGLSAATGYSAYLEPGGFLTRSAKSGTTPAGAPGGPICGTIQRHNYAGTLVWDFDYNGADYITHHDIKPMPNGNVLAICYERRTAAEVTAAGGSQNIEMWPDKIVEIQPNGLTGGTVVWEWKIWDHLVQSVDASKANYQTSVLDHPELLNINYKQTKDWIHMNGVDYNPILDQVAFSSHNMNEWYIIDHSTTTAEAAGHTGGNSGKGGDFLYRWGNPAAYGAAGTAVLNVTHDAHWIKEGCPNAGRLVGFNNKGVNNPQTSTVDQIVTPVNGYVYNYTAGQAYGPATYTDRHIGNGYSSNMGGSQQLPNGNQLVCIATSGKIYEINSAGTQLWSKTYAGSLAKAYKYDSCYIFNTPPAIPTITVNGSQLTSSSATTYQWYLNGVLINGATSVNYTPAVSGVYVVRITDANGCVYRYSAGYKYVKPNAVGDIDLSSQVTVYPNPAQDNLYIKDANSLGNEFTVSIADNMGNVVYKTANSKTLDVSSLANGLYILQVVSKNGIVNKRINIIK